MNSRLKNAFKKVKQDMNVLEEKNATLQKQMHTNLDQVQEAMSEKLNLELGNLKLELLTYLQEIRKHLEGEKQAASSKKKASKKA